MIQEHDLAGVKKEQERKEKEEQEQAIRESAAAISQAQANDEIPF